MSFDPTEELTEENVKNLVKEILDHGGNLTLSKHANKRMNDRNYTYRDIRHIIGNGRTTETEFNKKANNWKYTFEGPDLDGDSGKVVMAILMANKCLIITVI